MKTKKQKLNLNALEVDSFVTSMQDKNADTVKGGMSATVTLVSIATIVVTFTMTIQK